MRYLDGANVVLFLALVILSAMLDFIVVCNGASIYNNPHYQSETGAHQQSAHDHAVKVDDDVDDPASISVPLVEKLQLVDILVEMQKITDEESQIEHIREEEELVDYFFEDDIVLTIPQAEEILREKEDEHRKRRKRKLAEPLTKRWMLPIPYAFDGKHSGVEVQRILDALAYWQDLTCITFKEVPGAMHKLLFVKGRGCWSYVGFTHQVNQTVSIGSGCQSNGTIAHEVGHAIGFWHEQSRPDRDNFVTINKLNVTHGKLYNFDKRTWGEIITLDIPYDLGSDMHYGSKFYSKDENSSLSTVQTNDPLMGRVIGQRQELSFYDVKLANKAYCDDYCSKSGIQLAKKCQRDGYQDPKHCRKCRCPDGFGGTYCDTVAVGKNAICGGVLDATYNGTISSPGYPTGYYPGIQCSWLIKAPVGEHVYLQFIGEFGLAGHLDVCKDYVEVRYNTSLALTGGRFCIHDPPRRPIKSDGNELLVLFRSFPDSRECDDIKYPWKCKFIFTGFRALYYTKSCGGCVNPHSPREPACVKRVAYTCAQSWEEKVKIDCPPWWYTHSCQPEPVTKTRYATCHRDQKYCCNGFTLDGDQCQSQNEMNINIIPPDESQHGHDGTQISAVSGLVPDIRPTSHIQPSPSSDVDYIPQRTPARPQVPQPQPIPVQPIWTPWSQWGQCSRTCGGGVVVRTRTCVHPGYCGASNIQADKRSCNQQPCYQRCPVQKRILCELWTTCTRTVYENCNPYCNSGFMLYNNQCIAEAG